MRISRDGVIDSCEFSKVRVSVWGVCVHSCIGACVHSTCDSWMTTLVSSVLGFYSDWSQVFLPTPLTKLAALHASGDSAVSTSHLPIEMLESETLPY